MTDHLVSGVAGERQRYIDMSSIKSDEEIEALLNHRNNSLHKNGVKVKIIGSGQHGGGGNTSGTHTNRTIEEKATIALTAEMIGNKNTAELLNVNSTVVGFHKNGRNGDHKPNLLLREAIEEKLEGVRRKVVDKVDTLLEIFAEDKMTELEGKEIPGAIEKLVGTYDKVNRRNDKSDGIQKPQIILWAPKQINIDQYITKDVD